MSTPTPTHLGLEGVIAVANNKGGCGKTSVCANLAGLTAAAGIRTLVVDFDPQGNLGRDLGLESQDGLQLRRALED
ncbi:ParA family protein, partial [Streptomyces anthocyanicus]